MTSQSPGSLAKRWWVEGWSAYKRMAIPLSILSLLMTSSGLLAILGMVRHFTRTEALLTLLLMGFLVLACLRLALGAARNAESPGAAILDSIRRPIGSLVVILLHQAALIVAFYALVIPVLIIGPRLMFAELVRLDANANALNALKQSWQLSKGYTFPLLLLLAPWALALALEYPIQDYVLKLAVGTETTNPATLALSGLLFVAGGAFATPWLLASSSAAYIQISEARGDGNGG